MLLNMLFNIVILLLTAVISSLAEPISIPLTRMKSPLKHLIANAHKPQYRALIDHLESLRGSNDTVPLFKFLDYEFYGEVLIGHPGQSFKIVFDTSWADLWVPSVLCPSTNIACFFRNKYDASKSSTYKPIGTKYVENLGKYNLTGKISSDLVHLGKANILGQTFAEIDSIPWREYIYSKADGVFGLSFDTDATKGIVPFFYNMVKQKEIEKQIFSIYINRNLVTKKGGALLLGGIDPKHYSGNFTYTRADPSTGYWTISVNKITIKVPEEVKTFCASGCQSIIDSSTNEIRGPPDEIDLINQSIGAKKFLFGRSTGLCLPEYTIL